MKIRIFFLFLVPLLFPITLFLEVCESNADVPSEELRILQRQLAVQKNDAQLMVATLKGFQKKMRGRGVIKEIEPKEFLVMPPCSIQYERGRNRFNAWINQIQFQIRNRETSMDSVEYEKMNEEAIDVRQEFQECTEKEFAKLRQRRIQAGRLPLIKLDFPTIRNSLSTFIGVVLPFAPQIIEIFDQLRRNAESEKHLNLIIAEFEALKWEPYNKIKGIVFE